MTEAQKMIEDILQVAHQDNGVSIFQIQDALKSVLKDVDSMVEECRVKDVKPLEAIGYYMQVSGLWQKTTKEAFDMSADNGLPKARVNLEYWDESMEILRTTANTQEAIREVESYLYE
jgi:hypothetical protein